ncbi:hypothetical protein [Trichocoleus sp. FACHB-262]|uniref:hypothetical protein n=1 Tax=Trichocoleus sp. FACHB-262 TaxID=2692869 RepID=UPI00168778FA|nr:hypothetical protein [Trichocoleus sp. FACHB-262]MBD2120013.1 hypothetical protein [Trichocoleus sp. FACHB-262]
MRLKKLLLTHTANPTELAGKILVLLAIGFGFFSRVVSVFQYNTFDVGFSPDQVRDANIYMQMWRGVWPSLGPASSIGGYNTLPLYYYLVFPFTIFGPEPVFQALPNALFSFLSIPLLIYLVYQLLENLTPAKRLFLAGLAGFWYSSLFVDIYLSTYEWNPSPIPFFLVCFALLYQFQLENNASTKLQILSWAAYGVVLAILASLHSSTMFVMPVVFIASSILFIAKNRKRSRQCLLPIVSVISAIICLLPYWKGEVSRGWVNTKEIFLTVFNSNREVQAYTPWEKIGRILFNYAELGRQAYFLNASWLFTIIAIVFLFLVLILGSFKFKGNKAIFAFLAFTWLVYFYAASNHTGVYPIHFKMPILFSPIIFTVLSLAAFGTNSQSKTLVDNITIFSLLLGIVVSIGINLNMDYEYMSGKYGAKRVITTQEMVEVLNQLPAGSTICDRNIRGWRKVNHPYRYLDKYITKKSFAIAAECQPGSYALHSKFYYQFLEDNLWPALKVAPTKPFSGNATLLWETPTTSVYRFQ